MLSMYVTSYTIHFYYFYSYCNNADGQHNVTTITPKEAIKQNSFPLPIFQVDVGKIDVHFPRKFNSIKGPNVQPSSRFMNMIFVYYDL